MSEHPEWRDGIARAFALDGKGGARVIGWPEVEAWKPGDGPMWVHLERNHPRTRQWIHGGAGLHHEIAEALTVEGSRPRTTVENGSLLLFLRGINHNEGAEPEDMVALRMWVEAERLISLRVDVMQSPRIVGERFFAGSGAKTVSGLMVDLIREIVDRIAPVIDAAEERMADLEEDLLEREPKEVRETLSDARREAIVLRRYLVPQREAFLSLVNTSLPWMKKNHVLAVRESSERLRLFVDDLDAVRERALVSQEELSSRLSDELNKRMYVLSLVAAIFLPLGLITGLLGINVGGIPGSNDSVAFWFVCGFLLLMALGQYALLRRMKWM